MNITRITIVILVAVLASTINTIAGDVCRKPPAAIPNILSRMLHPGAYELVMVADEGSVEGECVRGLLFLRRTSADDRSPSTGEIVFDKWSNEVPLYRWVDIDLQVIGAPMSTSKPHPLQDSHDPVYPGVLVHLRRSLGRMGYPP